MASTMAGGAALLAVTAVPVLALMAPTAAVAQDYTSGVLSGHVTGADGTAVSGAAVSVRSAQGTVRTTTTNADGQFRMPALPVGTYEVTIGAEGFASTTQRASIS